MNKNRKLKRFLAGTLAVAMTVPYVALGPVVETKAQYKSGNAPFINSWLVSGPFDTAVADEIYNLETGEPEELVNYATTAEITASSSLSANPPAFVADGTTGKQWVAEEAEPTLNFTWKDPITLNKVQLHQWGDGRHVNKYYHLTFTLKDGSTVESGKIDSISRDPAEPTVYTADKAIKDVVGMKVEVDKGLTPYPSITGISEIEIYNEASTDGGNGGEVEVPENIEKLNIVGASATTELNSDHGADKAIDGNADTYWSSDTRQGVIFDADMELMTELEDISTVTSLKFIPRERDGKKLDVYYELIDKNGITAASGSMENVTPGQTYEIKLDKPAGNIQQVMFKLAERKDSGNTAPNHIGFNEVEVYGAPAETDVEVPVTEQISPVLGEEFGTDENDKEAWEYFDDRLYNRTYDDYQDLMGYFDIKKGEETENKYLYAHTYVYSPEAQSAYFGIGATGSYRVYVNDRCVSGNVSTPVADPQKDSKKLKINLKKGWNKVLIQLHHVYTEDVDSNGIATGADAKGVYAGFYGRITDASGNAIDGLISSVTGQADELQIVTGALSTDDTLENALPDNTMPVGYKEWPYVWNKSTHNNEYGVSASAFQFQAAGGAPGYTWKLVDGELPKGLHLKEDGTISDGLVDGRPDLNNPEGIIAIDCPTGDYTFTVEVTDAEGKTARKEFTITVKDRPNQKFEDGKVGALTHVVPIYNLMLDPNYDIDGWARRAKEQGHSLVSIESIQQAYFWPSKFNNPNDDRHMYYPQDENGKLYDALKPFEEAVKRYGMDFGLYYGPAFAPQTTDAYVQNLEDLITRYDPAYIYFDGPQLMGREHKNFDIIYSSIRNLNNDIIINANAWGSDYGDVDLRTEEAAGIYSGGWSEFTVKKTVMEPWKMIRTKNAQSPYYGMRDDYRQVIKEIIMNTGRGYVDNNDQTILDSRGPSRGDSISKMAMTWPQSVQEFIDVRDYVTAWFAPEGKPERHEAMTGTRPYFLSGCGFEDNGRGNWNSFALAKNGFGPDWGYAVSRDNNIYLHILKGPDKKKGFSSSKLADGKMTIAPVKDNVTKVTWFNEDQELPFTQDGETVTIDLAGVAEDQIDTIVKVQTDSTKRDYKLTDLYVTEKSIADDKLQLEVEGQMTFPALKANLETVTYTLDNKDAGISVDQNGVVTAKAGAEGTANVTVAATYEGVTVTDTVKLTAHDGKVYVGEDLTGVTLEVNGKETYGEFNTPETLTYKLAGRSVKGGTTGVGAADVKWHAGYVNVSKGTKYKPLAIDETDDFKFEDGKIITPAVEGAARAAVWADVTLDGKTYTTNKVFLQLAPYEDIMKDVKVTASEAFDGTKAENVVDGTVQNGVTFDQSRWSASGEEDAWLAFDLGKETAISNMQIHYNSNDQKYKNTPGTVEVQVSADGKEWETVKTFTGPSESNRAYFGFSDDYKIGARAQYVRLFFPADGNGSRFDIMEVKMNGVDANIPGKLEVEDFTKAEGLKVTDADDGKAITEVNAGDWAEYDAKVGDGGSYKAAFRVNIPAGQTAEFDVVVAGEKVKTVTLPSTNGRWRTIKQQLALPGRKAGIKLVSKSDGWQMNWIDFALEVTGDGKNDLPLQGMTATAGSQETGSSNDRAENVLDNNTGSIWHTEWDGAALEDRWIDIKLGASKTINGLRMLPRQSGDNGMITKYRIEVSNDNGATYKVVASGNWEKDDTWKNARFEETEATNVRLYAEESKGDYASAAEIRITKPEEPEVVVEKTDLMRAYDQYKDAANENYTDESWAAFQNALEAAKAVLDNADATQEEVDTAEDVLKEAVLKLVKNEDTLDSVFTITVDGKATEYKYNDAVTLTAPEKAGHKFAGWEVNGEIVSYDAVYKFYASKSMTFTATYVEDTETVKTEAKAMLTNVFAKQRDDGKTDVTFVGGLAIPEGYKLVNAGLVWSSKDGTELVLEGGLKPTYITRISDTNQFSVTIKGMPQGKSIRGKIFATVTDGAETKVIYSTEKKVTAK